MHKHLFNMPEHSIYLASHATGCLPKQTEIAVRQYLKDWSNLAVDAWDKWINEIGYFNQALSTLLNSKDPEQCCLQTNVSSAISKIICSLPKRKGRTKIIVSDMDYPTIIYAVERAKKLGYEIEKVASVDGKFTLAQWKSYLNESVQLVVVTHVLSKNNFQNPIKQIIQHANQYDIFSVIDVAQSIGILPINVEDIDADFVIGNCIKWLCGGATAGFLWANSKTVNQFEPVDVGWFSKDKPFDTSSGEFNYAEGARRFLGGTPAILACLSARNSMNVLNEIGINKIVEHNRKMNRLLIEFAIERNLNLQSPTDINQAGGTVCIKFSNPLKVFHYLQKNRIISDSIHSISPQSNIRLSPHIYTDQHDIQKLMACLAQMTC